MFSSIGLSTLCLGVLTLVPLANAIPTGAEVTPNQVVPRAPSKWVHPGVMISHDQINFIKQQVAAQAQPWTQAYQALLNEPAVASSTYTPRPVATIVCGPYSNPDVGCTAERNDSIAAYANALAWITSGQQSYANRAISIMNAYSSTVKAHTNSNAPLQSGWVGSIWARTAELIRYTGAGWSSSDITSFSNMLRTAYVPYVNNGSANQAGNWELAITEADLFISVFLEDSAAYDKAMGLFQARAAAYIYLLSDGQYPVLPRGLTSTAGLKANWFNQGTWQANGQAQELCRDIEHTGYGIASISHVSEMSRIQGTDLYKTSIGTRLKAALEFQSGFLTGVDMPDWLCNGTFKLLLGPTTEIGLNAFETRMGATDMPHTKQWTLAQRPAKSDGLFVAYETLTHAQNPY